MECSGILTYPQTTHNIRTYRSASQTCVGPDVLLRLIPVLLHAEVVDEGRAAPVEEEVEQVHEKVLDDQAHNHAYCLHHIVDQVELHGDHVPPLPSLFCSITQANHLVVLFVDEPRDSFIV